MTLTHNNFGNYPNFIGSFVCGANFYLEDVVTADNDIQTMMWLDNNTLLFYSPRISQGIVHSYCYGVAATPLDTDELDLIWHSDILVVVLPEGRWYISIVAQDAFGRTCAAPTVLGPYWFDKTAPTGSLLINDGAPMTYSNLVDIRLNGSDLLGVTEMRVYGDIVDTSEWQSYQTNFSVTLSDGDGERMVYARLRDAAGNVSEELWDSIVFPLVRYFFKNSSITNNKLSAAQNNFTIEVKDMTVKDNKMQTGDDHGRFDAY